MSEEHPDASPNGDSSGPRSEAPPWINASLSDLDNFDFEAPIANSLAADCYELADHFRAAASSSADAQPPDISAGRVFAMLAAITAMHFKPAEPTEPYGPMMTLADGRRTAIPSDFRGPPVDVLAAMAARSTNAVLRARLADISWLLERKRAAMGMLAIGSYVDTVQKVDRGELAFRGTDETGVLDHRTKEQLQRALQIGRAIGWEKDESRAARDLVARLWKQAAEKQASVPLQWFAGLDLDFGVSEPVDIALSVEGVLAKLSPGDCSLAVQGLWRLAARAYHFSKHSDDKFRCLSSAAECLVSEADAAEKGSRSALLVAHLLSSAIAALHGIPGKKARRTELHHRLIDVQARVSDDMSTFSHEMDLRDAAESVQNVLKGANLADKLFIMAALPRSPSPEQLVKDATEAIREHPLSSIFAASHLDDEGKVTHRTAGASFKDANHQAIARQIAQSESIRRKVIAAGQIEAARQAIVQEHFLSDDIFTAVLRLSPFVPPDVLATFARGFLRFFQGDFIAATYILVPLLENSLRYVLKGRGYEVTVFDDATQTQQDRTISSLFEQMRAELDEVFTKPITTEVDNLFLSAPGPQLRHDVAHGLMHDGTPYGSDAVYACALIFRLCLLPLYPYKDQLQFQFV